MNYPGAGTNCSGFVFGFKMVLQKLNCTKILSQNNNNNVAILFQTFASGKSLTSLFFYLDIQQK